MLILSGSVIDFITIRNIVEKVLDTCKSSTCLDKMLMEGVFSEEMALYEQESCARNWRTAC